MNVFQVALKNKYRYTYKGKLTTEDLYDLTPEELNEIYIDLHKKKKETPEVSLLKEVKKEDVVINNKMEIVKAIVDDKIEAQNRVLKAADTKAKRQKLLSLLAEKEDETLKNKTPEEIRKMLEELEG